MSTDALHPGSLEDSGKPLEKQSLLQRVKQFRKDHATKIRNIVLGAGILGFGANHLEQSTGNPVGNHLSGKTVTSDVLSKVEEELYGHRTAVVGGGDYKEPADFIHSDLGNGLQCKGAVMFTSMGKTNGKNEYIPRIYLDLEGLPPYETGTDRVVRVVASAKNGMRNGSAQKWIDAQLTGMGGTLDAETVDLLRKKIDMHSMDEKQKQSLDMLAKANVSQWEAKTKLSAEDQQEFMHAVIREALQQEEARTAEGSGQ